MNDMRAIMQDELRQALFGLLSAPVATNAPIIEPAPAPTAVIQHVIAIPPTVDAPPAAPIDNAGG